MLPRFTSKGYTLVFPSWHPMDRWDSGIAPDVIGPGFVGNLDHMLLNCSWKSYIVFLAHTKSMPQQQRLRHLTVLRAFSCETIDAYGVTHISRFWVRCCFRSIVLACDGSKAWSAMRLNAEAKWAILFASTTFPNLCKRMQLQSLSGQRRQIRTDTLKHTDLTILKPWLFKAYWATLHVLKRCSSFDHSFFVFARAFLKRSCQKCVGPRAKLRTTPTLDTGCPSSMVRRMIGISTVNPGSRLVQERENEILKSSLFFIPTALAYRGLSPNKVRCSFRCGFRAGSREVPPVGSGKFRCGFRAGGGLPMGVPGWFREVPGGV